MRRILIGLLLLGMLVLSAGCGSNKSVYDEMVWLICDYLRPRHLMVLLVRA